MRRVVLRAVACLAPCAFALTALASAPASAGTLPPGASELVATLLPEVVEILSVVHVPATPAPGGEAKPGNYTEKYFAGAGFIIDPTGVIVSNHHVVKGASDIIVILNDGTRLRAALIYTSPIDMVLLKVDAGRKLPAVKWGDSDKVRPGDSVIAIGNPLGIGTTVTAGIISALDRDIGETAYDSFLQTDAALNHGNSGGPLFNLDGEVVGVDTALQSPTAASAGLGFAIPINDVAFILDHYRKYGRVRPGYLGANVQPVTTGIAGAAGLEYPHGVIVNSLVGGSPAERANLRLGDIILKIGDLSIKTARDYNRGVAGSPFGETEPVVIWRDGAEQTVPVTFAESPHSQPAAQVATATIPKPTELQAAHLGLTITNLTPEWRQKFGLNPDQTGVLVTDVVPYSIAANHDLKAGDVVIRVKDTPVGNIADLEAAVDVALKANARYVLGLVLQGKELRWIAMPLVPTAD